jgi:glutamate/tyrosine decarboxylase-like PLP-dependent enzyme
MGLPASVNRIKELEKKASPLELDANQRSSLNGAALDYAEAFLGSLADKPAFTQSEDTGSDLDSHPVSEDPIPIEMVLKILSENVDNLGVNTPSAGNMAYIPGSPLYHSALGDYLAGVTNRYSGHFYGSPGAVRMENLLLRWMAELVGYPPQAAGNLTSGGSIAQLIAFITARETFGIKNKDITRCVVYLTEQSHHSVIKGLHIAGLGDSIRRVIPTDQNYRMVAGELEKAIRADKNARLLPWLVVATAGTTNTGAVDPLQEIGSIAKQYQTWYHIDGAYGAFFILCEPGKRILQGMQESDSLILDPHKSLFLPYGSGAVVVKEAMQLKDAFAFQASYTQDAAAATGELSPSDLSPELSKHSRGLRLWLPLMLLGTRPFEAALEEKILLARYFHEQLQSLDGFEVGPPPDLSIATFRYLPKSGDVNVFNRRLIQSIQEDGRIFLSSTTLDGDFVIRLAILGLRTHLETIDMAIDLLKSTAENLQTQ